MENAAKALLIAGGVLIAILLLTLFSYLITSMGESTANVYDTFDESEIAEFNQQFLNYEHREDLTAQDVATLINLAQDSNKKSKFPTTVQIFLSARNGLGDDIATEQNSINWLKENQSSTAKYICEEVNVNQSTLLVDWVIITRNE